MSGELEMVHELGDSSDPTQIGVTLERMNTSCKGGLILSLTL